MIMEQNFSETVIAMRSRTTRLEHEGDYWSEEEKERLARLFEQGVGISEIAVLLQRTEPAVIQQIEKMDLYQRREYPARRRNEAKPPVCLCKDCKLDRSCCPRCNQYLAAKEDA